jgi:hypothetical protein
VRSSPGNGDGAVPGLEIGRVAEILVMFDADESAQRGPGYRVTAETVLTAAHVVRSAFKVRVRFEAYQAGEWSAEVTGVLDFPEIDVALLTITAPDTAEVAPTQFGRIAERDAVTECSAIGFPLWKSRDDPARVVPGVGSSRGQCGGPGEPEGGHPRDHGRGKIPQAHGLGGADAAGLDDGVLAVHDVDVQPLAVGRAPTISAGRPNDRARQPQAAASAAPGSIGQRRGQQDLANAGIEGGRRKREGTGDHPWRRDHRSDP